MKICSVCRKENDNEEGKFCVFCGGELVEKIENDDRKIEQQAARPKARRAKRKNVTTINKKLKILLIILLIAFLVLGGIFIYLEISDNQEVEDLKKQNSRLQQTIATLNSENASLKSTNTKNQIKVKFFDDNIVFVLDGYGRYYYNYDQVQQVTQGVSEYTYWAYNKEQAINLGYRAWK